MPKNINYIENFTIFKFFWIFFMGEGDGIVKLVTSKAIRQHIIFLTIYLIKGLLKWKKRYDSPYPRQNVKILPKSDILAVILLSLSTVFLRFLFIDIIINQNRD